jgi:Na+/citrate or Na+/malate symporter
LSYILKLKHLGFTTTFYKCFLIVFGIIVTVIAASLVLKLGKRQENNLGNKGRYISIERKQNNSENSEDIINDQNSIEH